MLAGNQRRDKEDDRRSSEKRPFITAIGVFLRTEMHEFLAVHQKTWIVPIPGTSSWTKYNITQNLPNRVKKTTSGLCFDGSLLSIHDLGINAKSRH